MAGPIYGFTASGEQPKYQTALISLTARANTQKKELMMKKPLEFGSVNSAALTVLVENKADLIVESTDQVKYFTDKPLLAEHGFSALVQLNNSNERILWDAGLSKTALLENMRNMELDAIAISTIALSHGHRDHYGGMTELLNNLDILPEPKEWTSEINEDQIADWQKSSRIPLVAHPAAFRERWGQKEESGILVGPFPPPPREEWQAAGVEIILSEEPYQLAPGCWTTGFVPRKSFEYSGRSGNRRYREGSEIKPDDLEDDQAIVINLKDIGLVVLSGCAHSGIVNTIEHARHISGVDRVHAVIGGCHLAAADEDEIQQTIDYFIDLQPDLVVPGHCTGFKAISRFSRAMPDQFVEGVVGATYLF
jgi:7,8-dihydropterin-6-yl-methyl-4-(beta-D-ribofuranosyl)aminobenzene 5'-phosphate synthase